MQRLLVPLLAAATVGLAAAPAAAQSLPKLPKDTAMVVYVDQPSRTLQRAEAMAARIGMAPPGAPAGWITKAPAFAWAEGQLDLTRPVFAAFTKAAKKTPAKRGKGAPPAAGNPLEQVFADMLLYLPITKTAKPKTIVAGLSDGSTKLRWVKENGYLVVSEKRKVLRRKRRPRALDADALKVARTLDVAALVSAGAFDADLAQEALGADAVGDRFEDRMLKALVESALELAEASAPKDAWGVFGLGLAKDGLRITSQSRVVEDSLLGRWLLKMPRADPTHFVGHPAGPMMGGLGLRLDADTTVEVVAALFGGAKTRLSAADRKEMAKIEILGPVLEKGFRAHPALSLVARPGPGEAPRFAAVMPKIPEPLRVQIPKLEARPADAKLGLPKHERTQLDPETYAYLFTLEDRAVVAVGYSPGSLKDVLQAAKKDTDPTKDDLRFATARKALGDGMVMEAYVDPGPLADVLLRDPATARFRPLARLVGMAPPIVLGAAVQGDVVRSDLFIPEALLGVAGMAFAAMGGGPGGSGGPGGPGADGPSSRPARR